MKTNEEIFSEVIGESANIQMCRTGGFHEAMWQRARPMISYSDDNFAGLLQQKFRDVSNLKLLTELQRLRTLAFVTDALPSHV